MKKQNVLIPVDGSELSAQILPIVKRFFSPEDVRLFLFQAVKPLALEREALPLSIAVAPFMPLGGPVMLNRTIEQGNRYSQIEQNVLHQHFEDLKPLAESLRSVGFDTTVEVRSGEPASAIHDLLTPLRIDLIAMATHGREGLSRVLLGSVAEQVLHMVQVPILLLRPSSLAT